MPHRALVSGNSPRLLRGFPAGIVLLFLVLLMSPASALAQSGRIAGTVADAVTGEPLPGVNVVIVGTTQGSGTDVDGYYSIINARPGVYDLRASFIGYTPQVVTDVRVQVDLTTEVNFSLGQEVIEGQEVVVTAERRVIEPEVAASVANIDAAEIESVPVSSVSSAIGLQAGVEGGLTIRGSGADQVAFMVNGLSMRDERNNAPFTTISLTSVDAIQVQTGGFNAEYGNVRSGVVNVVTKEGSRNRYNADVIFRMSPPSQKNFGGLPNDPESFWIRPYIDPDVAWTGTANGAWDTYTQRQYPEFRGWVEIAEGLLRDGGSEAMTPEALQQAFLWQHRKSFEITRPDYTLDVGFGGPVPILNERFGDTRFFASYRRENDMHMFPLAEDAYRDQTGHIKLTSDIAPGMKLSIESMFGQISSTSASQGGAPGYFRSASGIASNTSRLSFIDARLFSDFYWAPTQVNSFMLGSRFTHTLSANTYYDIRFTRFQSSYDTNPGAFRDTTTHVVIGGVPFDQAPFGYYDLPTEGVDGMRMSIGMSTGRDTSRVTTWNVKGDLTSQLNRYLQAKTGFEVNLTESNVRYGRFDPYLPSTNDLNMWDRTPMRVGLYGQTRLELQGMVVNTGLRLDYSQPGDEWYDYDDFTDAFGEGAVEQLDTSLTRVSIDPQLSLSPRLSVSFPVTEFSKLFFNYGHFRSMPSPEDLFLVRYFGPTGSMTRIANPNNPLPRTIAYEVGYEHALFDQFLVRVSGYYKDLSQQPRQVRYFGRRGVEYTRSEPYSYADIRGFEFTFERNVGRWLQGFVNYTYMVTQSGYFGFGSLYENPTQQTNYERDELANRLASSRPVPQPYARLNLDFLTPTDFGPEWGVLKPLADWRISLLGNWRAGSYMTWVGGGSTPGVNNNVQFRDYWNWDMRFARTFNVSGNEVQFFADIYNLFNQRRLTFNGFFDGNDYNEYWHSLHLPESSDYPNIPGSDRPGDYRKPGVDFQPIVQIDRIPSAGPDERALYYNRTSGNYYVYRNGGFQSADDDFVQQVLDDKAYIDMPNLTYQTFLNPRQIYLGIRIRL